MGTVVNEVVIDRASVIRDLFVAHVYRAGVDIIQDAIVIDVAVRDIMSAIAGGAPRRQEVYALCAEVVEIGACHTAISAAGDDDGILVDIVDHAAVDLVIAAIGEVERSAAIVHNFEADEFKITGAVYGEDWVYIVRDAQIGACDGLCG